MHVGVPIEIEFNGRKILTSINKKRVPGPLLLRALNLDGDEQADLRVHGGVKKALYVYGADAFEWWLSHRPHTHIPYLPGAFGENLTVDFLPEDQIFVNDKNGQNVYFL